MITVKRSSLRIASIFLGLAFAAGFYGFFHYQLPWDWNAPGTGKLPQEIVRGFMAEAYGAGRGAEAVRDYFSSEATDNAAQAQDRLNGAPMPHEIVSVVAQGQTVVVIHQIAASRGNPPLDVIDVFETRRGRIVSRERYITNFNQ